MDSVEYLQGMLSASMSGITHRNWRHHPDLFRRAEECVWSSLGSVELSPAWFQQGHNVSKLSFPWLFELNEKYADNE
jgi:hypothetical protein